MTKVNLPRKRIRIHQTAELKAPIRRVRLGQPSELKKPTPRQKASIQRVRLDHEPHPLRLVTITQLAKYWETDVSTLWRWERDGIIPQRIQIGLSRRAWRESDLKTFLDNLSKD